MWEHQSGLHGETEVKPQDILRIPETTKFTYPERGKAFPEVVYKFQRRKRQVLVTITYIYKKTHMFCWFSGVKY